MYVEANYKEGTTAYMWITNKISEIALRIYKREREKLESSIYEGPKHLIWYKLRSCYERNYFSRWEWYSSIPTHHGHIQTIITSIR